MLFVMKSFEIYLSKLFLWFIKFYFFQDWRSEIQ